MDDDKIPRSWLVEQITVEEAERRNPSRIDDERLLRFPAWRGPFGGLNEEWEALKAGIVPNDELWTFDSAHDSWRHLAGRAGIALVREGRVVATLVTLMN